MYLIIFSVFDLSDIVIMLFVKLVIRVCVLDDETLTTKLQLVEIALLFVINADPLFFIHLLRSVKFSPCVAELILSVLLCLLNALFYFCTVNFNTILLSSHLVQL